VRWAERAVPMRPLAPVMAIVREDISVGYDPLSGTV